MGDLTKNFSRHEFACNCGCGHDKVSQVFVELLQRVRDRASLLTGWNFRMPINSGCRCSTHNENEGGYPSSDHITGEKEPECEGADIGVRGSRNRYFLCQAAFLEGVPRIAPAKDFVHLGMRAENDQQVMWVY